MSSNDFMLRFFGRGTPVRPSQSASDQEGTDSGQGRNLHSSQVPPPEEVSIFVEQVSLEDKYADIKRVNKELQSKHRHLKEEHAAIDRVNEELLSQQQLLEEDRASIGRANEELLTQQQQFERKVNALSREAEEFKTQYETERGKVFRLEAQLMAVKQTIATTTRLEKQVSDETIQRDFNDLFCSVQGWSLKTINLRNPDITPNVPVRERLDRFVPYHYKNSKREKLHCFVFIVTRRLLNKFPEQWVFGAANKGPVERLNSAYADMKSQLPPGEKAKAGQWVVLTYSLLNGMQDNPLAPARALATELMVNYIQEELEANSTLRLTPGDCEGLSKVVMAGVALLENLRLQVDSYQYHMVEAAKGGYLRRFDPTNMEDLNGEDEGLISASVFPVLLKIPHSADGHQLEPVLVSKAKVYTKA